MMDKAFNIAKIAGIPLRIHWTFGFFFVWIAYVGSKAGMDSIGIYRLCGFAVILFVCVVLHELGHALTARKYGVHTKDIIISPIGGVARLYKIPELPKHELIIAIAGPAVNLVIAIILGVFLTLFREKGVWPVGDPTRIFNYSENFLPALFWLNFFLIIFNLLPAFPMDGGRIFRSLLAMRLGRTKATRIASRLGQIIAVGFFIYGILQSDFILAFIGVFVFVSAANEFRMVYADMILNQGMAADVVRSKYTTLSVNASIAEAIQLKDAGLEKDFMVVDAWGQPVGVLHEEFIDAAIRNKETNVPVAEYLSPSFERVPHTLGLKQLFQLFQQKGYSIIPVYQTGNLIGVVDRKSLNEFLQTKTSIWNNWTKT